MCLNENYIGIFRIFRIFLKFHWYVCNSLPRQCIRSSESNTALQISKDFKASSHSEST